MAINFHCLSYVAGAINKSFTASKTSNIERWNSLYHGRFTLMVFWWVLLTIREMFHNYGNDPYPCYILLHIMLEIMGMLRNFHRVVLHLDLCGFSNISLSRERFHFKRNVWRILFLFCPGFHNHDVSSHMCVLPPAGVTSLIHLWCNTCHETSMAVTWNS